MKKEIIDYKLTSTGNTGRPALLAIRDKGYKIKILVDETQPDEWYKIFLEKVQKQVGGKIEVSI